MNTDPVNQRWRELAWRRRLTEAELAEWRAAHPESAPDAETEAALSDALAALPDAPVPSNFTARVITVMFARFNSWHSITRSPGAIVVGWTVS